MPHCFEVELAEKYGILEALLLNYFRFWIQKNEANDVHFHDGMYWTYNSIKAFCDLFPYASTKMIRNALDHLEEEGLLITGNFNKSPFDQTKWYALTKKGMSIFPKGEVELPHRANESCPTGQVRVAPQGEPIPVNNINNTYITDDSLQSNDDVTDNETTSHNEEIKEIVAYLNEKTGSKYRASTDATKRHINARFNEGFTVDDFKIVIDIKTNEWLGDAKMKKFLRPQTLFGTNFESYLNQQTPSKKEKVEESAADDEEYKAFMERFKGRYE